MTCAGPAATRVVSLFAAGRASSQQHQHPRSQATAKVGTVHFQLSCSANAVCRRAVGAPSHGIVEVAGPQQFRFDEFIRPSLGAYHDFG